MKPTPQQQDNLRKHIAFMRTITDDQFYFGSVVDKFDNEKQCGTVCCFMGWTPASLPEVAGWSIYGAYLRDIAPDSELENYEETAERIFGIERRIASDLFAPSSQQYADTRLPKCGYGATPTQVIEMLEQWFELTGYWK